MAAEPTPAGVDHGPLWVTLGSIGVAVITADAQGRIGFMNEAACSSTGWPLAQAVGRPLGEVFRIVDEVTREPVPSPADVVLREGRAVGLGNRRCLIRADGSELPIDDSAAPIRAADGTVTGAVTVFRDVTEQRAHDLAHSLASSDSEKRFQVMADTAPVLIWMSDPGMQLVWFNQGWLAFTGRTQAQEAGGGWIDGVHPDDRAHCLQTHRDACAARRPFSMDYRLRRHDGDYRWLLDTGSPRWDERGGFAGYIGSCVDITDRKEVEAALARSEALFRRVADANLIGVSFGNTEGRISYLNDEMLRMMGRTRAEFDAGRIDWVASIAPEFAASHESWTTQLLVQGIVSGYQRAFVRPDGSRTPFIGAAALLEPETNLHVNIALDLSPLKHAEEARAALVAQLRDADRRKDEFLATLAHELRNPLAPIANGLAILTRGDADLAVQAQTRATLQRQLQHMVRLIDDLLDVSRITRNRLELRVTRVLLSTVLEQAVEACRPSLDTARQPVQMELPDTPVWLQADPVRLVQVFTNLLGNAGKYSPPGSPVFVRVRRHEDGVDVIVRDQGIGIAPAAMPHIFEMFTQGERGPGQDTGGLGIGLALAQRLVQLHGGDMRAHSDGPGRGSEFVVRLPVTGAPASTALAADHVADHVADHAGASVAPAPPAAAATHWRILVVDDNHDATATLALLLQLDGHTVRTAHDGLQALEEAESFRPDAVLLDIGLPGLDGLEVARRLRTQPWGRHAVVLALTGWGQPLNRQASADAGFDAHLVKPVDHELLMRRLGELLRARATPAT